MEYFSALGWLSLQDLDQVLIYSVLYYNSLKQKRLSDRDLKVKSNKRISHEHSPDVDV